MITLKELTKEISALEKEEPSFAVMQKLANLYIVRDHMSSVAAKNEVVIYDSGSDFSNKIQKKDINEVLEVIDELMETLQAINPRLYEGVLTRL